MPHMMIKSIGSELDKYPSVSLHSTRDSILAAPFEF